MHEVPSELPVSHPGLSASPLAYRFSGDCLETQQKTSEVIVILKKGFCHRLCIAIYISHIPILPLSELPHEPGLADLPGAQQDTRFTRFRPLPSLKILICFPIHTAFLSVFLFVSLQNYTNTTVQTRKNHTNPTVQTRETDTNPTVQTRETDTNPTVQTRKTNTNPTIGAAVTSGRRLQSESRRQGKAVSFRMPGGLPLELNCRILSGNACPWP